MRLYTLILLVCLSGCAASIGHIEQTDADGSKCDAYVYEFRWPFMDATRAISGQACEASVGSETTANIETANRLANPAGLVGRLATRLTLM